MEAFIGQLVSELLPPRCGLSTSPTSTEAGTGTAGTAGGEAAVAGQAGKEAKEAQKAEGQARGAAGTGAGAGSTGAGSTGGAGASVSDFTKAVGELVKAKLEKPKRLGELAQRWWNEVGAWASLVRKRGCFCYPQHAHGCLMYGPIRLRCIETDHGRGFTSMGTPMAKVQCMAPPFPPGHAPPQIFFGTLIFDRTVGAKPMG